MSQFEIIQRLALRWLARRDYSKKEIAQKLKAKHYASEHIEPVLTQLIAMGYLNDLRFAEHYLHWRKERGYGPLRISTELRIRGISEEMIAEVIKIPDNAWLVQIHKIWQKHFKNSLPSNFKDHVKQIRFLQNRGFTKEQIDCVLSQEFEFQQE